MTLAEYERFLRKLQIKRSNLMRRHNHTPTYKNTVSQIKRIEIKIMELKSQ